MQLIKITPRQIAEQSVQTVNAQELHTSLEVNKDFSDWVKVQIARARLVENRDFVVVPQKGEQKGRGGHNRVEYHLTIDAAKHIAMVSGTDKGFEVREYFIECERRAQQMPAPMSAMDALEDPEMVRGLLLNYATKVIELRKKVAEQAPKVEALDLIATESTGSMCITNAAKDPQVQPKRLFAWLQEHQYYDEKAEVEIELDQGRWDTRNAPKTLQDYLSAEELFEIGVIVAAERDLLIKKKKQAEQEQKAKNAEQLRKQLAELEGGAA